ncbi:hypothetical protein TURU_103100 [Turdus rufiventris]|nr:hypothetical protein TURU_103100 [Turdus rufiventris]
MAEELTYTSLRPLFREVITKLGPLEWILNTPSHHRVHHGRNPYCIDKNYGGTLIIWDRIFGTFEAEDEQVVYGLTHPVNSFDPIMLQITGKEVPFNPQVPAYLNCYALVHFAVILDLYTELLASLTMLSQGTVLLRIGFIVLSLLSFGLLMENKSKAGILEIIRCLVFMGAYKLGYFRSQFSFLDYAYEFAYKEWSDTRKQLKVVMEQDAKRQSLAVNYIVFIPTL